MLSGKMLVEMIDEGFVRLREGDGETNFPIRGSRVATCPRQLGFELTLDPAKRVPMQGRQLRNFAHGKAIESAVVAALGARLAGDLGWSMLTQVTAWTPVVADAALAVDVEAKMRAHPEFAGSIEAMGDTIMLRSHLDIVLLKNSGHRNGEIVNVEVKSIPGFKVASAQQGDVDEGYLAQVACQSRGLEFRYDCPVTSIILNQSKESGDLIPVSPRLEEARLDEHLAAIESVLRAWVAGDMSELRARFAEDAFRLRDGSLPWQCRYCRVGPVVAGCVPGRRIEVGSKSGVPTYRVV